jgi:hypothetical protein
VSKRLAIALCGNSDSLSFEFMGRKETSMSTLEHAHETLSFSQSDRRSLVARAPEVARHLLAAIAAGSDHPLWKTPDAADRAALLPRSQHDRLLAGGYLPVRR